MVKQTLENCSQFRWDHISLPKLRNPILWSKVVFISSFIVSNRAIISQIVSLMQLLLTRQSQQYKIVQLSPKIAPLSEDGDVSLWYWLRIAARCKEAGDARKTELRRGRRLNIFNNFLTVFLLFPFWCSRLISSSILHFNHEIFLKAK
ncbi:hypothetical protein QL285_064105 [Trifolium repens]|nr:hypothetical protein QL285_064105 [Trifolium repens]